MKWKPFATREIPDAVGWFAAVLTAPVWGALIGLLWLEKKHREIFGPTREWRPWFAWHPVTIWTWEGAAETTVWLEHIWRREKWGTIEYTTAAPSPVSNGES